MDPREDRSLMVFFDLETTPPPRRVILELGAILVCPRTLVEKYYYRTFIRPDDLYVQLPPAFEAKGITAAEVACAPSFSDVADDVFYILQGRVWAGHNILEFDEQELRKAFYEINRRPPKPKEIIDTYPWLEEIFGRRAGNMKLPELASYFGLEQKHRSLDDVRLNLQVLKNCATALLLESRFPILIENENWLLPSSVDIDSINTSLTPFSDVHGNPKIQIFHKDVKLKLCCTRMIVRYGINRKFSNLTVVVDIPPELFELLNNCEQQALKCFEQSGGSSNWNEGITFYGNVPNIRLRIRGIGKSNDGQNGTEVCMKETGTSREHQIILNQRDELEELFSPGDLVDAFFYVDTYDYERQAGIRLVAEKLVICS